MDVFLLLHSSDLFPSSTFLSFCLLESLIVIITFRLVNGIATLRFPLFFSHNTVRFKIGSSLPDRPHYACLSDSHAACRQRRRGAFPFSLPPPARVISLFSHSIGLILAYFT